MCVLVLIRWCISITSTFLVPKRLSQTLKDKISDVMKVVNERNERSQLIIKFNTKFSTKNCLKLGLKFSEVHDRKKWKLMELNMYIIKDLNVYRCCEIFPPGVARLRRNQSPKVHKRPFWAKFSASYFTRTAYLPVA